VVTIPVPLTEVVPLDQMPPPVVLLNVTVVPAHTAAGPVMDGAVLTVTIVVTLHEPPNEYVITAVPVLKLETMPVDPTVATAGVPLDHVPPGVMLLKVVVLPAHMPVMPVIATGGGVTVTVVTTAQPPTASR
jgi:hypothetical protein